MFYYTKNRILFAAIFFLVLSVGRLIYCIKQGESRFFPDLVVASSTAIFIVLIDIYRLNPASSHTFKSLILQYIFLRVILVFGFVIRRRFDKMCQRCKVQQQDLLKKILAENKDTMFARDYSLANLNTVNEFREAMPLTQYENYRKYVEMIKENGTENVLFPEKAYFLALTSGTTSGKSKMFPKNPKARRKSTPWVLLLVYSIVFEAGSNFLKKWLYVKIVPKLMTTKSGIESGAIAAITYKINFPFAVTPNFSVQTEYEVLYINLVFSLAEDNVACFSSMVSTTALSLLTVLENDWKSLCNDIENGKLSENLKIPVNERKQLSDLMKPNPKRAAFLRKEFSRGFKSIVSRIWPECPCLIALKTGVFETPAKIVKDKYLGDLPIVSLLHNGTESMYGMNINPMAEPNVNYSPLLPLNFFEFIPVEKYAEKSPSTLLAYEVKVGQMYEMVVTTFDGLYRYRTEDVVMITGFHGTAPLYEFMHRAGDILSANLEKVPEFLLHEAVYAAASVYGKGIVEFTSCESVHLQQANESDTRFGHLQYVVFIELRDKHILDEHEMKVIDEELCQRHTVYAAMRRNNRLKPVRVIQLKTGTFDAVRERMLASNPDAFCMQYKLPRIMRRNDILKVLLEMEI